MDTPTRKLLTVVMDGIGHRSNHFGNAVSAARTPNMDWLQRHGLFTSLKAHGTAVGLPSDNDMGNSEVGHNTLGAGRSYDQGAKLVNNSIKTGRIFTGKPWIDATSPLRLNGGSLHFIGLVSDGNVHSHQEHLFALTKQAHIEGIKKIRVHVLLDGRDTPSRSAEIYIKDLEEHLSKLRHDGCDAYVASGGGRMSITMDRYGANWSMVQRGWDIHVCGEGPRFPDIATAIAEARKDADLSDQDIPGFVIEKNGVPRGKIIDGDSVILFNFRGDRAIEISQAFCDSDKQFTHFHRQDRPSVYFAGMMEYDGDEHIPKNFLVSPPSISGTMGELLASKGVRQFACSETQKYGHVTYFWNGNRSGYFDESIETYVKITSDSIKFNLRPAMKAQEITERTLKEMMSDNFQFGRINFANGDMVGHTGDFESTIIAVSTVDLMLGHIIKMAIKTGTILVVTADHGNADEMFEGTEESFPNWDQLEISQRPKGKTSHSLAEVPFFIYDPRGGLTKKLIPPSRGSLANFANTALELMGIGPLENFSPSLLIKTHKTS